MAMTPKGTPTPAPTAVPRFEPPPEPLFVGDGEAELLDEAVLEAGTGVVLDGRVVLGEVVGVLSTDVSVSTAVLLPDDVVVVTTPMMVTVVADSSMSLS